MKKIFPVALKKNLVHNSSKNIAYRKKNKFQNFGTRSIKTARFLRDFFSLLILQNLMIFFNGPTKISPYFVAKFCYSYVFFLRLFLAWTVIFRVNSNFRCPYDTAL